MGRGERRRLPHRAHPDEGCRGRGCRLSDNPFHAQLAQKILTHVRVSGLQGGHHLTEASLQALLGTSRAPVRAALALLAARGVVEKRPNHGFFVGRLPDGDEPEAHSPDEPIYLAIAHDRLSGALPEVLGESEAMRRYGLSRARLGRILDRIAKEGWIERREGRGWAFLPMIDSVEAYGESYELRRILEPAGLRAPTFVLDRAALAALTAQQEMVHRDGWRTLGQIALFETNSHLHEGLAAMSGNRFLVQTIARQNQLRRLVEYRQTLNRDQVRRQNDEHLAILSKLADDDREGAAVLLEEHLGGAKKVKARASLFVRGVE